MSSPLVLPSGRAGLVLVLRPIAIVVGVLLLYALTPVNAGPAAAAAVLSSLASIGLLLWIVVRQTRRIARHAEPTLAAVEALTLLGTLFVLSFSMTYVALSASDLESFSQPVGKVAAIYFSMTVMSTVGFGDIVAVSDVARMTVVVQMIANLVLLALVVRIITGVARWARTQRLPADATPEDASEVAGRTRTAPKPPRSTVSALPETEPPLLPGDDDASFHRRALAREFFASALYVALVLLAALVALPRDRLPTDRAVLVTLMGTALGLVLAHFVAFRFAAHFTAEAGRAEPPLVQEAAAGVAGGVLVAIIAGIPYVVFDGDDALLVSLIALATFPAIMGGAIARLRGRSGTQSLAAAGVALLAATVVVYVKDFLGH